MSGNKKIPNPYGRLGGPEHQQEVPKVGRQTKDGRPVKRELNTMKELENDLGIKTEFHPYNKKENEK